MDVALNVNEFEDALSLISMAQKARELFQLADVPQPPTTPISECLF